jgi:hypothetical protein
LGEYTRAIKRNPEPVADATKTAGQEINAEEIDVSPPECMPKS